MKEKSLNSIQYEDIIRYGIYLQYALLAKVYIQMILPLPCFF
jgi:hypothetical protein